MNDSEIQIGTSYAYFPRDFESTLKHEIDGYSDLVTKANEDYKVNTKPAVAYTIAHIYSDTPRSMKKLANALMGTE